MTPVPIGLVEERLRSVSRAGSTGLNCSSCRRVDEDIISRIRALILSQHHHHPPTTPHNSDESGNTADFVAGFDFNSAPRITKSAHEDVSRLSIHTFQTRHRSASDKMERRGSSSGIPTIKLPTPPLRSIISAEDVRTPKRKFRFPKLVLQDKKEPVPEVKSCIEISRRIPSNDAQIHQEELICCVPCDPPEVQPSKYLEKTPRGSSKLPGPAIDIQPADLACFLAGCPPGQANCVKHGNRKRSINFRESIFNSDTVPAEFRAVAEDLKRDVAKLGLTIQGVPIKNSPALDGKDRSLTTEDGSEARKRRSRAGTKSPIAISPMSPPVSSGSMDAFPLAAHYMELAATEKQPQFSTSIATNFSLPGYKEKGKARRASAILRNKLSNSTLPFKKRSFAHPSNTNDVASSPVTDSASLSVLPGTYPETPGPESIDQKLTQELVRSVAAAPRIDTNTASLVAEPTSTSGPLSASPSSTRPLVSESIRNKTSEASLKSKTYTPSLLSGASRMSGIRHALLKPSVTAAQPLDTGLPVPPMLSPNPVAAETQRPIAQTTPVPEQKKAEDPVKDEGLTIRDSGGAVVDDTPIANFVRPATPAAIAGTIIPSSMLKKNVKPIPAASAAEHLSSLQKASELVEAVKGQIKQVEEEMLKGAGQSSKISNEEQGDQRGLEEPSSSDKPKAALSLPESHKLGGLLSPADEKEDNLFTLPPPTADKPVEDPNKAGVPENQSDDVVEQPAANGNVDAASVQLPPASVNAAYWGFAPTVKEAVQGAVEVAVRNAVQDIVVPKGPERDEAAEAYRKLMADSLAQAAQKADDYLRHPSLWNHPPSHGESEGTVVYSSRPSKVDARATSVPANPSPVVPEKRDSRQSSVGAKNQENQGITPDKTTGAAVSTTQGKYGQIGGAADNFKTREDLSVLPGVMSDELETIPLENEDKFDAGEDVPGWKLSKAFKKGYTPISTRKSSKNRVLSPKTSATNSISKFSPRGTVDSPVRKRSFERLVSKAGQGLRSISSATSLRSVASDKQTEKLLPSAVAAQAKDDEKALPTVPGSRKLSRKNTVHWLRELLSANGPYETRFTALPPRTRKDYQALNQPPRSLTAPTGPVSDLYVGKLSEPAIPKPAATKNKRDKRVDPSETFSKTINDLEHLMNEALLIARQAADSQDPAYAPRLLGNAVQILKDGRKPESGAEYNARIEAERRQSKMQAFRSSDESSAASAHESLLNYSESSDSAFADDEDIEPPPRRAITIESVKAKAPSRHASGWPPTGRISTPFPPASIPASHGSSADKESPAMDKKFSSVLADRLLPIAADPRSMPTELDVDIRRQSKGPLIEVRDTGASRKVSVYIPQGPQDATSGEPSPTETRPEFRDDPFSDEENGNLGDDRRSSRVSPRRLSPLRKSGHVLTKSEDVVLDLCGDPVVPRSNTRPLPQLTPGGSLSQNVKDGHTVEQHQAVASKLASKSVPSKREVRGYILQHNHPLISPRSSSLALRQQAEQQQATSNPKSVLTGKTGNADRVYDIETIRLPTEQPDNAGRTYSAQKIEISNISAEQPLLHDPETRATSHGNDMLERFMGRSRHNYSHSYDGSQADHSEVIDFEVGYGHRQRSGAGQAGGSKMATGVELQDRPDPNLPQTTQPVNGKRKHLFSLGSKRHLSLRDEHLKGFSFTRSHKKQAIARDWSPGRKRFVATVACISTALIGIIVGIYAGSTPAIQYYIVDFHHYTVLGNVFFFIGLAVPTFIFWPLPLLHGRKPYILGAMSLAMPLLFPQALAVGQFRSPYVSLWRIALILPRALMGFCLGFANMNFLSMLTDLFGASLQSENPHQEHVDEFDVRRHGGGMGVWLGLWTWCSIGSIGFGFMIGAVIINSYPPAWGFYVSICIIAFVMLLNVVCPEVRRSAFRRSVAEVVKDDAVSRRLARGEVKMHMVQSGPKWWGEELHYGVQLSKKMLRQPGFLIMALYTAWIYGQMVLIISLLGALVSKDYRLKSTYVGASVTALPAGALLAIPFQKASFFSRARSKVINTDDATLTKKFNWSSHMLRRSIFVLCLPLAGAAYTISSGGPPTPLALPIIFAALIGFLSSLALAECSGIMMETFDTSDLQPGMTGRPRGSSGDKTASKRTNYSSFPRVQSAFAMSLGFGYLIAAAAAGLGGSLTRHIGQRAATGVMAGILLVLSILLLLTLIRFTNIQIIPDSKKDEMEQYHQARRASTMRREEGLPDEEPWRPIIIGNPHHVTRRMCLLELGSMSRFSEIRRKNKLVDEKSLEAKHPNRAAIEDVRVFVQTKEHELRHKVSQSLSRNGSNRSRNSRTSKMSDGPEQGDLGGHREMLKRGSSGKGSRRGAPGSGRKGTSMQRKGIEEHEMH